MSLPPIPGLSAILGLLPAGPVTIPDPDPIPLPGPIGLLRFLLVLTLFLHLLPMNFVLGGSVLTAVSYLRARSGLDEIAWCHRRLIELLARAFPVAIAFTITLGIAPLLFVQVLYGPLFFSSSILMAWLWLALVGLLLLGYYAACWHTYRRAALGEAAVWVSLGVAATFLVIAFLFVNNFSLLQNPEVWRWLYLADRRGLHLYAAWDASVFPRYLHVVFASLALTGLAVAAVGVRRGEGQPEFSCWARTYGGRWFLAATTLQMASGLWFLWTQPPRVRAALLGRGPGDTLVLVLAIGCGLAAMASLTPPSRISARRLGLGSGAIGITVALMVLLRQRVRTLWLDPHFRVEQLPVASQWGAILLFLVLLLAGLGLVAWMLWEFFQPRAQPSSGT